MGLEQATPEVVAEYRARRIALVEDSAWVLDGTCGIGADSLALSATPLRVVSCDLDPFNVRLARANLLAAGRDARVVQADARDASIRADFLVLDPDRRASGRRSLDPQRWSPRLEESLERALDLRGACIKLPPAFAAETLEPRLRDHGARLEWVSLDRELCELTLWLGELAHAPGEPPEAKVDPLRSAVALDRKGGEQRLAGEPISVLPLAAEAARSVSWLAEPDPALIRSGLLGLLASLTGLAPLGPEMAYLGGDAAPQHPMLRCWRVLGSAKADPRQVRSLLARHDVGPLVVKKRGHPDTAERLAQRFRGRGSKQGLLIVSRIDGGHCAYLAEAQQAAKGDSADSGRAGADPEPAP